MELNDRAKAKNTCRQAIIIMPKDPMTKNG